MIINMIITSIITVNNKWYLYTKQFMNPVTYMKCARQLWNRHYFIYEIYFHEKILKTQQLCGRKVSIVDGEHINSAKKNEKMNYFFDKK